MSPVAKGNEVRVRGWGRRREGGRRERETLEHKTQRQMKQARGVHTRAHAWKPVIREWTCCKSSGATSLILKSSSSTSTCIFLFEFLDCSRGEQATANAGNDCKLGERHARNAHTKPDSSAAPPGSIFSMKTLPEFRSMSSYTATIIPTPHRGNGGGQPV